MQSSFGTTFFFFFSLLVLSLSLNDILTTFGSIFRKRKIWLEQKTLLLVNWLWFQEWQLNRVQKSKHFLNNLKKWKKLILMRKPLSFHNGQRTSFHFIPFHFIFFHCLFCWSFDCFFIHFLHSIRIQFTHIDMNRMLNLIENPLRENGWSFARLDGSMTLQQRRQQLEAFKTQSKVRLLLMSLKAGGLGLNLTEANYVFMLDPWWNRKDLILFSFLIFSLSLSLILFWIMIFLVTQSVNDNT